MKQREYDQAFNVLGNTLCQDPGNPKALLTLAAEIQVSVLPQSYILKNWLHFYSRSCLKNILPQRHFGYDEALAKYTKAVTDLSECSETWNNIGMCFFGKHKYVAVNS